MTSLNPTPTPHPQLHVLDPPFWADVAKKMELVSRLTAVWGYGFILGKAGCPHLSTSPGLDCRSSISGKRDPETRASFCSWAEGSPQAGWARGTQVRVPPPRLSGRVEIPPGEEARKTEAPFLPPSVPGCRAGVSLPEERVPTPSSRAGPRGLSRGNGAIQLKVSPAPPDQTDLRNRARRLPASARGAWGRALEEAGSSTMRF